MLMPYWINSKFKFSRPSSNESRNAGSIKFKSSLSRSNPNLDKRDLIQLNNGFVDLTDDTRVWITPSGAVLSVKY